MYDTSWHSRHGAITSRSAQYILSVLLNELDLRSMLDVGCGDGRWIEAAKALGVSDIAGVDGPWTDRNDLRFDAEAFSMRDLGEPFDLSRRFDLAICLEVAEHVAFERAEALIGSLVRHSDVVLFGAAIPFQGGFRHINERWQSWWAERFSAFGYVPVDAIRPLIWNETEIHYWYRQNALVYVAETRTEVVSKLLEKARQGDIGPFPLDIVHPENYEVKASYEQIAFKPLLRRLPTAMLRKARSIGAEWLRLKNASLS